MRFLDTNPAVAEAQALVVLEGIREEKDLPSLEEAARAMHEVTMTSITTMITAFEGYFREDHKAVTIVNMFEMLSRFLYVMSRIIDGDQVVDIGDMSTDRFAC